MLRKKTEVLKLKKEALKVKAAEKLEKAKTKIRHGKCFRNCKKHQRPTEITEKEAENMERT